MDVETPKSSVQLGSELVNVSLSRGSYRAGDWDRRTITGRGVRKGTGNLLLSVRETGVHLATRSSVGRLTTRQMLTAQTPHTTGEVWRGDRERSAGIRECQKQLTVTVILKRGPHRSSVD